MKKHSGFHSVIGELIGLVIITVAALIAFIINTAAGYTVLICALIYGAVILAVYFIKRKNTYADLESSGFSEMFSEILDDIDAPIMVVNESNRVVWSNPRFDSIGEVKKHRVSTGAAKLFGGMVSYFNLESSFNESGAPIIIDAENAHYSVKSFPLEFRRQKLYGAIWYSRDTEASLRKELEDSSIRVAYIVIDNTNEVTQEVQENRRFGSATVNGLLTEWAAGYDAVLTEYDRDKYVMQFENRHLEDMIADKFDILDKVVEASLRESPVPMTISIGVSSGSGTLQDKRESAQAALRSALQRGGALAVVKTKDGEDSYGGRTKAVQRQTKIRSRLCRDLLCEELEKCSNVIIMGHINPDFDSIASNIGISKLVAVYGKPCCIVADRNDRNISRITETLDEFPEYSKMFVDEVYAQELLSPKTLVIITDVSNPELFAARGVYENASRVIVIDHHAIKTPLGPQVLEPSNIDPTASSASELVCEILELSIRPGDIRPEEARVLLAGILLDTQFFSHDTGTRTYSACIFLKNAGADPGKAKNFFKSDMSQFVSVNKIEQNMEIYRDCFAISVLTGSDSPENKVTASKAADRLVDIDGVSASFVLYSLDNGVNLSARSDGSVNVINIAHMLGGGGHFQSAGALIRRRSGDGLGSVVFDTDEAKAILKSAIDEYVGSGD
ncbi:MAG: DHH family phosphoesterase [Clostridia bacterium]|nr:DHH family phosphoesterase [Clostridia bacterium]